MRGRKPKPRALKLIQGSRRVNSEEPILPPSSYDPPAWLEGAAREKWKAEIKGYVDSGLITIGDRDCFAAYCDKLAESLAFRARAESVKGTDDEFRFMRLANKAHDQALRLSIELGLTPSSRSRVKTAVPRPGGRGHWEQFKPQD